MFNRNTPRGLQTHGLMDSRVSGLRDEGDLPECRVLRNGEWTTEPGMSWQEALQNHNTIRRNHDKHKSI